jgi:predicted DNA-binding transcriptional regulator YafY
MSIHKSIEIIAYLDHLIRSESTGCAHELAEKLGVSQRTVYSYLRQLRELGAPIKWQKAVWSYVYKTPGKINLSFCSEYPPEPRSKSRVSSNFVDDPGRQDFIF